MLSDKALKEIAGEGPLRQAQAKLSDKSYSEALALVEQRLLQNPTPAAYYLKGQVLEAMGKDEEAVEALERAVMLDPSLHQAYADLAEIVARNNYFNEAIECWALAIQANPASLEYKERFLVLASRIKLKRPNPALKKLVLECLETENLDLSYGSLLWHQIVKTDPASEKLFKHNLKPDYGLFRKAVLKGDGLAPLADNFFLKGLQALTVCLPDFEQFLTRVRRLLLEERGKDKPAGLTEPQYLRLAGALAHYCFYTEYVFYRAPEEEALLEALYEDVQASKQPQPSDIALFACYKPLSDFCKSDNIAAITALQDEEALPKIIKVQITDHQAQQELKQKMPQLTAIKNAVSEKVQEQYETHPYPRWRAFRTTPYAPDLEGRFIGQGARMLVAGCGTGREAIEMAAAFPTAQILAVDLSATSLAYGSHIARQNNITNIDFRQGDILELDEKTSENFDYIASSGVLHHMADPMAGWETLVKRLKPGGLMRIGLYSQKGRRAISQGQKMAAENNYGSDDKSIRQFRHDMPELVNKHIADDLRGYHDWYFLSECRDLLFHVQEQQFTLPEIDEALERLGLVFQKFYIADAVTARYRKRFSDDPDARSLKNWAKFEESYPDTFREMYRFWCVKPE